MSPTKETIDRIVSLEWDMFQLVNEGGPRADCQDDRDTFDAMRRAQFEAWSGNAAECYLEDLTLATLTGRNLIFEKYAHMMRTTAPERYAELTKHIKMPTSRIRALAREVCAKLVAQTEELHRLFPYVADSGRPLHSEDDIYGTVSVETYQLGELLTYSDITLAALLDHIDKLAAQGKSLAREILLGSVRYYGYASLEDAEKTTRERMIGGGRA
ncbi:MAG: DUF4125 family protein [Oscillospiraceae bacterium]|jgi:hypothetical protein|nr:DUF4125 family protein [Oscillospiraceae bacterium]